MAFGKSKNQTQIVEDDAGGSAPVAQPLTPATPGRIVTYHSELLGDVPAIVLQVHDDQSISLRCFVPGQQPGFTKDFELMSVSQSPDLGGWSFAS